MFDKMKNMMGQMKMMQHMMKDENFRAFISHPKIQELFRDPAFQELIKKQDMAALMSHPKMAALRGDAELMQIMSKLKMPK